MSSQNNDHDMMTRLEALEHRVSNLEGSDGATDRVHWAWRLHRNADSMQHQRHMMFIVGQSIFFAGFVTATAYDRVPAVFCYVLGGVGLTQAILWMVGSNMLEKRLDAMRRILTAENPTWREYQQAVSLYHPFGGRVVFNWYLPLATIVAWIILICVGVRVRIPV
jgi:hypothetical protein